MITQGEVGGLIWLTPSAQPRVAAARDGNWKSGAEASQAGPNCARQPEVSDPLQSGYNQVVFG